MPSRYASQEELEAVKRGQVDARACVHCYTLTFAQHTQTIMQSNLKGAPPPYIEEMQRDLRVAIQAAQHIILMGYSLAPDDVTYRALLAARKSHVNSSQPNPVKCSVIVGHSLGDKWLCGEDLKVFLKEANPDNETTRNTIRAAIDIFGEKNVRFYGNGIPQVFQEAGTANLNRLKTILNWPN